MVEVGLIGNPILDILQLSSYCDFVIGYYSFCKYAPLTAMRLRPWLKLALQGVRPWTSHS